MAVNTSIILGTEINYIKNKLKAMFETEIEDYGESIKSRFLDRFFPVEIDKREDILTISDKRCFENLTAIGGLIVLALVGLVLLIPFRPDFWGILILIGLLSGMAFLTFKIFRTPYKRFCIFDKNQNIYRIIKVTPTKNNYFDGKLEEIKKVKIEITEYVNRENRDRSYSYQAFLIFNSLMGDDDSNALAIEENSIFNNRYKISAKIAFAIADFLQLPIPEDEQL